MDVTLSLSRSRVDDFRHPDENIPHARWTIHFTKPNPDYDPEDEYDSPTYTMDIEATSYRSSQNEALNDIKRTLRCTVEAVLAHRPHTSMQNIAERFEQIPMDEVEMFIRLFDPKRKSFKLNELQKIPQYQYIYYSTRKFIEYLFEYHRHDIPVFDTDQELFDWINYEKT